MTSVTRFAPSPTGDLHLGHAYSALYAAARGDRFLLRFEDIDITRTRSEFYISIENDLKWLGLTWEEPVRRQSEHLNIYKNALDQLEDMGLLYPCFCTRKDIAGAASAPHGSDGPIYPGTCRHLSTDEVQKHIDKGNDYALRLDTAKAIKQCPTPLHWHDIQAGKQTVNVSEFGDIVLARKNTGISYHLCVTVDDHIQDITLITRGKDLFRFSAIHRLLQQLLGLNIPQWEHHPLLTDQNGNRLAKRDDALSLKHLREVEGWRVTDVKDYILIDY